MITMESGQIVSLDMSCRPSTSTDTSRDFDIASIIAWFTRESGSVVVKMIRMIRALSGTMLSSGEVGLQRATVIVVLDSVALAKSREIWF